MTRSPATRIELARIELRPHADLARLWRSLEAASDASFFQSWTWVGCLAAERFDDPWLLRAEQGGEVVGLALFNRASGALWLGESGRPALDGIYVEHNGPLLAHSAAGLLPDCLAAALRGVQGVAGPRRVRLAGVSAAVCTAARAVGTVRHRRRQSAPLVDFAALDAGNGGYLASLSQNTRYQLRRSDRAYAAAGKLTVQRAETLPQALEFLDALAALHQATWTARGRPGAFAQPWFRRFHHELLARALPRDEADLLRIAAGGQVVGYLYNFRHRGRALAYQSGFDYAAAPRHGKPGLTCHHAAIALAHRQGMTAYDFLAGEDRYKASLSNAVATLHWLDVAPRWSLTGAMYRAATLLERLRRRGS